SMRRGSGILREGLIRHHRERITLQINLQAYTRHTQLSVFSACWYELRIQLSSAFNGMGFENSPCSHSPSRPFVSDHRGPVLSHSGSSIWFFKSDSVG